MRKGGTVTGGVSDYLGETGREVREAVEKVEEIRREGETESRRR